MAWELHEGGRPGESLQGAVLPAALLSKHEPMCPECSEAAALFLQRADDAVSHAGRLPDDQVWLSVFSAMQAMLTRRDGCGACVAERSKPVSAREAPAPLSGSHFTSRLTR